MRSRFELSLLAVAGFSLAAVMGARPDLVWLLAGVPMAVVVIWRRDQRGRPPRTLAVAALTAPCVAVGAVLAWYNRARFGSVAEFGVTYQLLGENYRLVPRNQFSYLRKGVFEYLLACRARGHVPVVPAAAAVDAVPHGEHYLREPVAGLLPGMPAAVVGRPRHLACPAVVPPGAAPGSTSLGAHGGTSPCSSRRHVSDAQRDDALPVGLRPLMLLASVVGWVALVARTAGRTGRVAF